MPKQRDPHRVLGIERGAAPAEVKRAYRRLVLLLHPDVSGDPASAEQLRDVQSAYQALCDASQVPVTRPPQTRRAHPSQSPAPQAPRERSGTRDLMVELTLSRHEARTGMTIPLRVPLPTRCPRCLGTGLDPAWVSEHCGRCLGRGFDLGARELNVVVPPGVQHGEQASVPLGIGASRIVVLIRVE